MNYICLKVNMSGLNMIVISKIIIKIGNLRPNLILKKQKLIMLRKMKQWCMDLSQERIWNNPQIALILVKKIFLEYLR